MRFLKALANATTYFLLKKTAYGMITHLRVWEIFFFSFVHGVFLLRKLVAELQWPFV